MSAVRIEQGDCRKVLAQLFAEGLLFDAIVTDPPYELGFMGKKWDATGIAYSGEVWRACFRLMRPGAHLVAFGGTRTYHRMACAIEDAGFEIRDQIAWLYASGFPKSHDVSKAIDRAAGAERKVVGKKTGRSASPVSDMRGGNLIGSKAGAIDCSAITAPASPEAAEWEGWGTALKPAFEPICLARKPLRGTVAANVLKHGTGALNVDACRIETNWDTDPGRRGWQGTALCQSEVYQRGFMGIKKPNDLGRWPANVAHDGSEDVLAAFGAFGERSSHDAADAGAQWLGQKEGYSGGWKGNTAPAGRGDSGSAARFFFSAKADAEDRWGSKHPTVKPVELIRWLVRLVVPPDGLFLDPFAGSGTAGIAALAEKKRVILIEQEPDYIADIRERLAFYEGGGVHSLASRGRHVDPAKKLGEDLPLLARRPE